MTAITKQIETPEISHFDVIKGKQQAAWSSGDYSVVGSTLQIVGETLCETLDLRAGQRVLDVAAGNGNVSLAAARRYCDVTSTDYVQALLERARARAEADGLDIAFRVADAEALPFDDGAFDVVTSSFGVMFAPDQETSARELLRVCRSGGKIGLANWTPESFIGRLFKVIGKYVPPAPGLSSPALWGTRKHISTLFGAEAACIDFSECSFAWRYKSAEHWLDVWRSTYGPLQKAFDNLSEDDKERLAEDLIALIEECNAAEDGTMVVYSEYLEIIVTKA